MKKLITKETLKKWRACAPGFARFCALFPDGADLQTASKGLIDDGHKSWSDWLWRHAKEDDEYVDQTTVTGGDGATVIGGYRATVIGGDGATVIGGYRATATGGDGACLVLKHYDPSKGRYFVRSTNVGENGIKPNTPYKLSEDGKTFMEVE